MASKRLEYIDAMRGFTMFLVVLGHIIYFGGGCDGYDTVLGSIFITFRMPLFFFISGFIAYKSLDLWDFALFKQRLLNKAQIQLIPAIVFFCLFCFIFKQNILETFLKNGFGKYWFTPVLFEMFMIYFTCSFLFRKHPRIMNGSLILFALAGLAIRTLQPTAIYDSSITQILTLTNLFNYFQYFVLGYFVRRYSDRSFAIVDNDCVNCVAIIFYAVSITFINVYDVVATYPLLGSVLRHVLTRYAGLFIVFAFFFKHRNYFASDGYVSRTMQFVGRRTLDIYLLHYFIIPMDMPFIRSILDCGNIALQFACLTIISSVIIGLCLVVSEIIRNSNFLSHYLFGAKRISG